MITLMPGRVDVSGLPPTEIHILIATAFDRLGRDHQIGIRSGPALQGQAGRIRILQRHAPQTDPDAPARCAHCRTTQNDAVSWPCDDYQDAAAGVATGLETYRAP